MSSHSLDPTPALLALDWGTSSLRAFLLAADGRIIATRANHHGIQHLPQPGAAGFRQVFADTAGDWLDACPGLPVVAGGMVGSAQGWAEAPYVDCPADTATLAQHAIRIDSGLPGCSVLVAPGLIHRPPGAAPDVMRGEEIQIAGALAARPELAAQASFVMPGTHSKWVSVRAGRVQGFATYMTGELFAVLSKHSILGRLLTDEAAPAELAAQAFARGVAAAEAGGPGALGHLLFAVRTLGLTKQLDAAALKDYLSGLLIGSELVAGRHARQVAGETDTPLALVGDAGLCRRYAQAMALLGLPTARQLDNTAPAGLLQFARAAGLLP